MKRRTKQALISTLTCGLLATSTIGAAITLRATAATVGVKPTGTNTNILTQAIDDADLDSFTVYGASTRTKDPNGFRFLTVIDEQDLSAVPNGAEFGLLIIPTALLGEAELTVDTKNALMAPAQVNTAATEVPDGGIGYYITLVGETLETAFPENLYNTVFTARAYIEYTYEANGETVTDYVYSQSELDRSIAYVASCELVDLENNGEGDTDENSFLNQIISNTTENATLSMSKEEVSMGSVVTVELQNATDGVNDFKYTLASSNETVATVNENGEVVTVAAGTTEITATIGATKISKTLTVKGPETFTAGDILYSTRDGAIFMPNGLLDEGETIISAVETDSGVDYFDKGTWKTLAQTDEEIKTNLPTERTLTVRTSDYDLYNVNVKSYAGVIDELNDFPKFFDNTAVASEFAPDTYPDGVAPNVYGYYIVIKNLGTGSEELAFTQTEATDYNKANGFNGVLDGQGHTLQFTLKSGGLVGMILGNATIKNLGVIYTDATSSFYGVFGYRAGGATVIENCYIRRIGNNYKGTSIFGIVACTNGNLQLHNTVVYGEHITNNGDWYSNMYINENSSNAFLIYARADKGVNDWAMSVNFTEIVESNILASDLSSFDTTCWTMTAATGGKRISWTGTADSEVSLYDEKYVAETDKELLYSTLDNEMLSFDGLLSNGETIVDAYDLNGVDCFVDGIWTDAVALTDDEIQANATRETTIVIETSKGYFYQILVKSYAGVIDQLTDFNTFFDNTVNEDGTCPSVYGYYVVAQDIGSASDTLALVQTETHTGKATEGFNGILDGQGHTLRFTLTSGGLVGMVLGNGVVQNLAVIFKDATSTSYGVFGAVANGAPVIRNCYIEQTEDHFNKKTTYGIMDRPRERLVLENTVVYGYFVKNDNTYQGELGARISPNSTNAYVIHARNVAAYMSVNFTKVYSDGTWDGSRSVPLSDITDASGFDDRYWYKENGSLIWKGFETVTVSWVKGKTVEKQNVTKGNAINVTSFGTGYWSLTEGGEEYTGLTSINSDTTFYAIFHDQTLEEKALYSTRNDEFFLPTAISDMESVVSITDVSGEYVYYENGVWYENFALSGKQINNNETMETQIMVYDGMVKYYLTVVSYAGVIDELDDFPRFFNNTAVPSETNPTSFPAVTPNVYGYYIVTKNLGTGEETVNYDQVDATDYTATNGFNGVLDGQGHTLNFQLGKGALLGFYLGQATIKNLGIIYADLTYDANNYAKTGYGVLGAKSNGVSVLENCYIKRTSNPYKGTSVFGIMASPNNKLVLKNTVIDGANTTNDGVMHSNMFISADSENAFLIYARNDKATVADWTIAKNFDEVVVSNIVTGDLSGFNADYWTTEAVESGNRITWSGTEDLPVGSFGFAGIAATHLAQDGETDYAIVLPANADEKLKKAAEELTLLFREATGSELTVVTDANYNSYGKYISIGNTRAFQISGISLDGVERQGYLLRRVDNTIYVGGKSSLGCLYGVYGLMEELFEYKQYSTDTYHLNADTTVAIPVLNKTENPDIGARVPSNGALENDSTYAMRMGMTSERYILPAGDYRLGTDAKPYGGKWENYHNTLEILPPLFWKDVEGKTNWFSDDDGDGTIDATQLCYTAHGNSDDYNAMVAQIVDVMTLSLATETYSRAKYPEAVYITLTSEDTETSCQCSACVEACNLYGSNAGAVIKLCNDVRAGLETWMNNKTEWKRELYLLFFAYNNYVDAPTVTLNETTGKYEMAGGLEMRSDVGVYYAISNHVNYYFDINDSVNDTFRAQFDGWAKITQVNNSPFCLWTYTKNFSMYMLRADVYGEGRFFNKNAYSYFAKAGVDLYWNQGAANGTTTLSAFEKLNGYLDSQFMWNSDQDVTALTDEWFSAMYGTGSTAMKNLYDDQNAKARSVFGTTKLGIPTVAIDKDSAKGTLTSDVFTTWFGYITSAKTAVNADTTLTEAEKTTMIEHINEEWISVKFLYVWLYYQTLLDSFDGVSIDVKTAKAEFREVLGYDSSTATYAKDVVLLEKAGCTLVEWVESDFTASV